MKKKLLTILFSVNIFVSAFGQLTTLVEAPPYLTFTQVRAPNGTATQAYLRAAALVLASELTNIANGTTLTAFGFTLDPSFSVTIPVTGNFTVYLENTTDLAYNKGTNFANAIAPMTTAYTGTMTVTPYNTSSAIILTLSTPFVYTGGGIYVAYDWASAGPFSTVAASYRANGTGLLGGCVSAASSASPAPNTLGSTNFRPSFIWGYTNPLTNDIEFIGMETPGGVAGTLNTPHVTKAIIKNSSSVANTNIPVTLNVGGANPFVDTQTITSLAAGATTVVNFAPFNPGLPGLNTVSVTLPSDQNNANNLGTYNQSVTCNVWAMNPSSVSYTMGSVGFNTGSGIIAVTYSNPVTSTLTGLRGSVSTNVASVGNNSWGVLLSSTGSILATTNTVAITNTLLGTFATYSFATPQNLVQGSTYYFGFAQPTGTVGYFPMGTYTSNYVPFANYVTTSTLGGVVAPLASNLGYFNIEAIFAPNMTLTAASQSVVCGSVADLTVSSSANYTWNTGPTNTSISVTPTLTTVYSISASNTLGCLATKNVTVTIDPLPVVASSNSTLICVGETVTLTASGAPNYSWSAGSNPGNPSFTDVPLTTTTYSVEGSNSAGCTNTGVVTVQVVTFSTMVLSNSSITTCLGNSISISATGANSYTWNTGTSTSSNSILQINPPVSAVYSITGADALGCEDTQTVVVTVNSFTPGITTPTSICYGQQIVLNATGGAPNTYTWSTGMGFTNITVTPTVTTGYSVVATGTNGCPGFAGTTITVNINPTVTAVSNRSLQCVNESNSLSAFGATSYSWSSGETTSSISITPAINVPVSYTVTGISAQGCTDSKVLTILVNACTNINEQAKRSAHIQLFPNPFKNLIELNYENVPENTTVKVLNALGQNVLTLENINDNTQINLENQANGLYFITIIQNKKATSQFKVVKQ